MLGCSTFQSVEKTVFRTVNRFLEPTIRVGIGSPWLVPVGAVVMETTGRKSGRTYNIPVVASEYRGFLVASTVRGSSQWMKNVAAVPDIGVWLRGKRRACTAYVIADGEVSQSLPADMPKPLGLLVDSLTSLSKNSSASFVILALAPVAEEVVAAEPVTVYV